MHGPAFVAVMPNNGNPYATTLLKQILRLRSSTDHNERDDFERNVIDFAAPSEDLHIIKPVSDPSTLLPFQK